MHPHPTQRQTPKHDQVHICHLQPQLCAQPRDSGLLLSHGGISRGLGLHPLATGPPNHRRIASDESEIRRTSQMLTLAAISSSVICTCTHRRVECSSKTVNKKPHYREQVAFLSRRLAQRRLMAAACPTLAPDCLPHLRLTFFCDEDFPPQLAELLPGAEKLVPLLRQDGRREHACHHPFLLHCVNHNGG